jgi:hypothetical protein
MHSLVSEEENSTLEGETGNKRADDLRITSYP